MRGEIPGFFLLGEATSGVVWRCDVGFGRMGFGWVRIYNFLT